MFINTAVKRFRGIESYKKDLRKYDVWYDQETLQYLVHLPGSQLNVLRLVFLPQGEQGKSFFEQMQHCHALSSSLQKPALFISFEPSEKETHHYIVGLYFPNRYLIMINPLGLTQHVDFYQQLYQVKCDIKFAGTQIYMSTTQFQFDQAVKEKSIVSCGALCAELLHYWLQGESLSAIEDLVKKAHKSVYKQEQSKNKELIELHYNTIDIQTVLSESLVKLTCFNENKAEDYIQAIITIRNHHDAQLAFPRGESELKKQEDILDKAKNAPEQNLFRQLCFNEILIENIKNQRDFQLLKQEKTHNVYEWQNFDISESPKEDIPNRAETTKESSISYSPQVIKIQGDGNCAFNAFALAGLNMIVAGLFDVTDMDNEVTQRAKTTAQQHWTQLLKKAGIINNEDWNGIKVYLKKHYATYALQIELQCKLQKYLREETAQANIRYILHYSKNTLNFFMAAFDDYRKHDDVDDIFIRCQFIKDYFIQQKDIIDKTDEKELILRHMADDWNDKLAQSFINYTQQDGVWVGDLELAPLVVKYGVSLFVKGERFGEDKKHLHSEHGDFMLPGRSILLRLLPAANIADRDMHHKDHYMFKCIDANEMDKELNASYEIERNQEKFTEEEKNQILQLYKTRYITHPEIILVNERGVHWDCYDTCGGWLARSSKSEFQKNENNQQTKQEQTNQNQKPFSNWRSEKDIKKTGGSVMFRAPRYEKQNAPFWVQRSIINEPMMITEKNWVGSLMALDETGKNCIFILEGIWVDREIKEPVFLEENSTEDKDDKDDKEDKDINAIISSNVINFDKKVQSKRLAEQNVPENAKYALFLLFDAKTQSLKKYFSKNSSNNDNINNEKDESSQQLKNLFLDYGCDLPKEKVLTNDNPQYTLSLALDNTIVDALKKYQNIKEAKMQGFSLTKEEALKLLSHPLKNVKSHSSGSNYSPTSFSLSKSSVSSTILDFAHYEEWLKAHTQIDEIESPENKSHWLPLSVNLERLKPQSQNNNIDHNKN